MSLSFGKILGGELGKNSAKLLSANVFAQAVGLLVYPLLTRLYSSADFGLLNLFVNVGGVLVLISTFEYQYAILLPKDEDRSKAAMSLSVFLLLCFTGLLLLLLPARGFLAGLLKAEEASASFVFLPLFVLLNGGWNILNMYFTRRKQYWAISHYKVSNSLLQALLKTGFGYGGVLSLGMVYSSVIAPLLSADGVMVFHRKSRFKEVFCVEKQTVKAVAREYRNFPVFSLPRSLVNSLGFALPALMLTPFFGLSDLGYFSMAIALACGPLSMIAGSIQQVLFQQTTEMVNNGQSIVKRFNQLTFLTLTITIPLFVGLYFVLPPLVSWLLGADWVITGEYIRLMLPWLLMICLNGPICFIADVFMQQKVGLVFEIVILLGRVGGLLAGILTDSFAMAVVWYSIMSAATLAFQQAWFYYLIHKYERGIKEKN